MVAALTSPAEHRDALSEVSFILLGTAIVMLVLGAVIRLTARPLIKKALGANEPSTVHSWTLMKHVLANDYPAFLDTWLSMDSAEQVVAVATLARSSGILIHDFGHEALDSIQAETERREKARP